MTDINYFRENGVQGLSGKWLFKMVQHLPFRGKDSLDNSGKCRDSIQLSPLGILGTMSPNITYPKIFSIYILKLGRTQPNWHPHLLSIYFPLFFPVCCKKKVTAWCIDIFAKLPHLFCNLAQEKLQCDASTPLQRWGRASPPFSQ